ncbi:MAG: TRAP transporter small permease [Rhodospirillaceae bacterium]|nr:TRAP transporter small permease [Rhodospirillaceae bacterium]MBT4589691.1 TRAP transporter small permease [Rhodospirillaceae bacterium]MBT7268057.1 TRAP transporter small permease [Rhodospirillaceae bacterium]
MSFKLKYLEQRSTVISRSIAVVGLIGLITVTLVIIADVLLRWLFSAPIEGLNEVLHLIYAIIMASFFPTALIDNSHITIRFVGTWLGPKVSNALDAFGGFMTFLFFVIVGWQFVVLTEEFFVTNEVTWVLAWPVAPWWGIATFLLLLCIPVQAILLLSLLTGRSGVKE